MLKKAGIVVAAATAAMLAVSPLAFAGGDDHGDKGGHGGKGGSHSSGPNNNSENHTQSGLVNVQDVHVQVPIQACNNNIDVIGVSHVVAALGLLAPADASTSDSCNQGNVLSDGPTQGH